MRSGAHSRADTARKWLIFWTLFIGLGAVAGAAGMLADPTGKSMGMDATLPYFQKLPLADVLFQNFVFSGIALLIVNGLTNLTAYEHVTICSPIWVFALAAPTRAFCQMANGQIREADYILVHHTRGRYQNAADEMDRLLGLHRTGYRSIRCHIGRFTPINTGKGGYTDGSDRVHS